MMRTWLGVAVLLVGACGKGSGGEATSTSSSASASASPGPSAAGPAPVASAAGPSGWKGAYKSVQGTIVLPKDVKWKVPESAEGVGDGTIALEVDRATRRVQGKVDGVLGPAKVDGMNVDGKITATVSREDPTDHGFAGTLSAEIGDAGTRGTMNVALADVSAVRNATFELEPVR
jgi:hypothetical protein